ncbi:MAG: DUF3575 domain-containing protein [Bacteroidia bacterium]|nr:DUF3575 domain-containing protein [Bacteroidia bacterium]
MLCTAKVYSQELDESYSTIHLSVSFARNNSIVNLQFSNNLQQLEQLEEFIGNVSTIHKITILSNCSPDGALWRNTQLSRQRADAVNDYLMSVIKKHNVDLRNKIEIEYTPEDWIGLQEVVEQSYNRKDKEQLISILKSDLSNSRKKKHIMELSGGESFNYLMQNIMPLLRKSVVVTIVVPSYLKDENFEKLPQMEQCVPQPAIALEAKAEKLEYKLPAQMPKEPEFMQEGADKQKEYIFNIKTNLLLPLLNVGIEVPIKEKYTVGAEFYYPWIKPSSDKWCAQMLAWFIEGKYWFTQKHALGVYTGAGYYDFQDSKSGDQGEFVDIGVDYTYSIAVGAKKWMKIQFNLGLGYVFTTARHYHPTEDYEHLIKDPTVKKKNSHFVGPTRAGVSLVFPIRNFWKGGAK